MPHHFRTIEAFVQLLEQQARECDDTADNAASPRSRTYHLGKAEAFDFVLRILRTSNIGIVYPPPERNGELARRLRDMAKALNFAGECSPHKVCLMQDDMYEAANLLSGGNVIQPNGTRCPDCGLPVDPSTGTHTCSDGQVRGFRVSP